jgi:predicted  nucleic acid-binding Zn-ribbon protein
MGLCGDAVRVAADQLERLWNLQQLIISQRRLVADAKELSKGESLGPLELTLQRVNEDLRSHQLSHEQLEEDKRKLESDLELVEKRIASDEEKLKASSSPKDIAGFQHEIEGLMNRKNLLEDSELALLEKIELSSKELSDLKSHKAQIEAELESARAELSQRLAQMRDENSKLNKDIGVIRGELPAELVELFERKLAKGNAVGRIVRSSCTGCNMNLNSTAMAELSHVPADELATCPECSAIVIRA